MALYGHLSKRSLTRGGGRSGSVFRDVADESMYSSKIRVVVDEDEVGGKCLMTFHVCHSLTKGLHVYLTIPCSLLDRYLSESLELFNFGWIGLTGSLLRLLFMMEILVCLGPISCSVLEGKGTLAKQ